MSFSLLARKSPFPALFAVVAPLVVLGLKFGLEPLIGQSTPFLLFFSAVIIVAWNGGLKPGILASIWSGLLASYFFLPPTHTFSIGFEGWMRMLFFIGECIFISQLTAQCHAAQDALSSRTYRQAALAKLSGIALSQTEVKNDLFERACEICAQTLHISRVVIQCHGQQTSEWPFQAITQSEEPLAIEDMASAPLPGPTSAEIGASRSLLGARIGDAGHPVGVILALHDQKRRWLAEEKHFLLAIAGILAVATERTRAETARRSDEARYRAFVEQSSEAIWCCDFEPPLDSLQSEDQLIEWAYERGVLSQCNDAFAHLYGYEHAGDIVGAPLESLLARDDPRNLEFLRAFVRSGFRLNDAESVELDRNGQKREFLNNLMGILEEGQLTRAWGTQRDVTSQKEAHAQLRASEARFRALFDAAPVAIAISRGDLLLYVNRASVELLGCQSIGEMIGQPVNDFVAPPDRDMMQKRIERRLQGFEEPLVYEATSLRRDGTSRPLRIEVAPLELPDGTATLAFAFDLSQEKAEQRQREQMQAKERRAAQRAAHLQEITAALAATLTSEEVATIIVGQGVAALGARSGAFSVPQVDSDGPHLRIMASVGYADEILRDYGRIPLDRSLPAASAVIENRPYWIGTQQEAIATHPIFAQVLPLTGTQALCALPLEVEGRVLGVLSLSFDEPQDFDADVRAFMLTLAGQCAQALDRVRLFNEARDAARMQEESLALLHTLLNSAPVGFAFFDLQGRYVLANEGLTKINGLSVEEHLGRQISEVSPELGQHADEIVKRVIETGIPSGEMEVLLFFGGNPGAVRHCLASYYPVRAGYPVRQGEGEILGVGAVVLDITSRVLAERERVQLLGELEIERARFEAILQQMPSAVIIGEAPSGRLILGNPQVEEILKSAFYALSGIEKYSEYHGYTAEGRELLPQEWPLSRAISEGEIVRGEEIGIKRGDGSRGVIRLNAAPIRDRDGHIAAGVVIFDDITQRSRADSAQRFLADAGSSLLSILDENAVYAQLGPLCAPQIADWCVVAIPDQNQKLHRISITHCDTKRDAAWQNEVAARFEAQLAVDPMFPWDISGVMGQNQAKLYPAHSPTHLEEMGASENYARLFKEIGVQSAIVAPLSARGRVLGVLICLTASSGRIYDEFDLELVAELARRASLTANNARLYREAQTARDEAQNANRAKDEFLAVVSHELRTPLTPILGWLELLRDPDAGDAMRHQAYDVIERNAKAQAQLVNDILDVSRITTGKLRLELKPLALAPLVLRAIESLRPNAQNKKIALETAIFDVGQASADANRLQQVVWNLLQNAIKFTPEGGNIRVSLEKQDGKAIFRVADSGSGIESDFLPHVFDRFRQGDSSSTRRAGGLGLGLAIVSHIVEGHDGQVSAQSQGKDKGATFSVALPLLNFETAAPTRPDPARPKPPGLLQGARVLIIDDEADTRFMLKTLLERNGAAVQIASCARETFEKLADFTPDVMICDIGMPETDGYELRRQLTARGATFPSIALTAYTAPSDVQKAREAGFDAHLSKPLSPDGLLETVRKLWRRA